MVQYYILNIHCIETTLFKEKKTIKACKHYKRDFLIVEF